MRTPPYKDITFGIVHTATLIAEAINDSVTSQRMEDDLNGRPLNYVTDVSSKVVWGNDSTTDVEIRITAPSVDELIAEIESIYSQLMANGWRIQQQGDTQ